jgi:hypothetical protein
MSLIVCKTFEMERLSAPTLLCEPVLAEPRASWRWGPIDRDPLANQCVGNPPANPAPYSTAADPEQCSLTALDAWARAGRGIGVSADPETQESACGCTRQHAVPDGVAPPSIDPCDFVCQKDARPAVERQRERGGRHAHGAACCLATQRIDNMYLVTRCQMEPQLIE